MPTGWNLANTVDQRAFCIGPGNTEKFFPTSTNCKQKDVPSYPRVKQLSAQPSVPSESASAARSIATKVACDELVDCHPPSERADKAASGGKQLSPFGVVKLLLVHLEGIHHFNRRLDHRQPARATPYLCHYGMTLRIGNGTPAAFPSWFASTSNHRASAALLSSSARANCK